MMGTSNSHMDIPTIPSEIFRLAVNNFDSKNLYIKIGSNLDKIMTGINRASIDLDPQPQLLPMLLPFVTIFQYLERLIDRKALDSIRNRIEWKYALHLPVSPPVLRETIFCEYRRFLLEDKKRLQEFQKLIDRLLNLISLKLNHQIDSVSMLREICEFNQKDAAVLSLNKTLRILKINHPKWLTKHDKPRLYARYLPSSSQYDVLIPHDISQFHLDDVLRDIDYLLNEVAVSDSPEIKKIEEIKRLTKITYQIRRNKGEKQTASNCDKFIAMLEKEKGL